MDAVDKALAAQIAHVPPAAEPESDDIYAQAHLRPIHDALLREIGTFGEFEIAPMKGCVSLRRKKQFAIIGPATYTRFEVGLNWKDVAGRNEDAIRRAHEERDACHGTLVVEIFNEKSGARPKRHLL